MPSSRNVEPALRLVDASWPGNPSHTCQAVRCWPQVVNGPRTRVKSRGHQPAWRSVTKSFRSCRLENLDLLCCGYISLDSKAGICKQSQNMHTLMKLIKNRSTHHFATLRMGSALFTSRSATPSGTFKSVKNSLSFSPILLQGRQAQGVTRARAWIQHG